MLYPTGYIKTEIINNENGVCIFKAVVGYYSENSIGENNEHILGTGTAYEKEGSSFINKTSYIENCETSAVGRALGMAGFGIDTSIASFEEVANAIQQQDEDKIITKVQEESLDKAIENRKISDEIVLQILSKYGYSSTAEIKIKDYMLIVQEFQKLVQK